jgi:hypothetical protein
VAAAGIIIGATAVANAAEPSLPAQSVAQLLADVGQAAKAPPGPLTATIQTTANLGLPALPQVGGISGPSSQVGSADPLAGTTTVSIWYLNQDHVRIAEQAQMAESDLRLDGTQVWLWNSQTQTATHVLLPKSVGAAAGSSAGQVESWQSPPAGSLVSMQSVSPPLAAARQALALLGPSTRVTLGQNVTVAGRAAYQISVAPRSSGSLISQVLIAIDAARHIPLRVEVFSRTSASPAYEVGYTALTFGPPAQSNFSFTPPPGAKVKTITVPSTVPGGLKELGLPGLGALGALGSAGFPGAAPGIGSILPGIVRSGHQARIGLACRTAGKGSTPQCASLPKGFKPGQLLPKGSKPGQLLPKGFRPGAPMLPKASLKQIEANFAAHLPASMTKAQRAAAIKSFDQAISGRHGFGGAAANGGGFLNIHAPTLRQAKAGAAGIIRMSGTPLAGSAGAPKVLGTDWTSVVATPASPAVAAMVQQLLASARPGQSHGNGMFFGSSAQAAPSSGSGPSALPVGPDLAVLRALLQASTAVHGSWGSGRLLQSALLSVLLTSKGQVLAGAVTPSVLYADAASQSR